MADVPTSSEPAVAAPEIHANGTKAAPSAVAKVSSNLLQIPTHPAETEVRQHPYDVPSLILNVQTPFNKNLKVETTPSDVVLDIRQFLLKNPDTSYITCFHLECNGTKLNDFIELGDYPMFSDPASSSHAPHTLVMVEDLYDERAARVHVRRLREILVDSPSQPLYSSDALLGLEHGSMREQKTTAASADDNGTDFRLSAFHDLPPRDPIPECVRNVIFSSWNPPPGNRGLRGDLLYLEVTTLENHTLHITASVEGFYVNNSTRTAFDPTPYATPYKSTTLVELLKKASPLFGTRFTQLLNKKMVRHPFDTEPVPVPVHRWLSPVLPHTYDWNRAEDVLLSTYGMDPRGILRDWNEEYQSCRDLPAASLPDRILRDRTLHRVYADFVAAAVKGAQAIVHGNIPPINPGDPDRTHVYLYNNIFFSFAVDGRNMYKGMGINGDMVAYAVANHDLMGVTAYSELDLPKLHVLAHTVVNYRGHRVTCQSIIAGIFHDQTSEHLYGSMDNGRTIKNEPEFHKLLLEAAKKLHIAEHPVFDEAGSMTVIAAGYECKGMSGSDRRRYVLDVTRLFPRDANFPDAKTHPTALIRPELLRQYCRSKAFQKVLEIQRRTSEDTAAAKSDDDSKTVVSAGGGGGDTASEQSNAAKVAEEQALYLEALSQIKFNPDVFTSAPIVKPIVKPAAANTVKKEPGVENKDEEWAASPEGQAALAKLEREREEVRDISRYLNSQALPALMNDFLNLTESAVDTVSLGHVLHERGINIRYLGVISAMAHKYNVKHVEELCVQEMIVRAAKHILHQVLKDVRPNSGQHQDGQYFAPCIVTFLNNFLGEHCCGHNLSEEELNAANVLIAQEKDKERRRQDDQDATAAAAAAATAAAQSGGAVDAGAVPLPSPTSSSAAASRGKPISSKSGRGGKKKDKGQVIRLADGSRAPVDMTAPANLWQRIRELVKLKYNHELPTCVEFSSRAKLCMLRSLCLKVGIQIACREYTFDGSDAFSEDDILDLFPVVKTNMPRSKDACDLLEAGKAALTQGSLPVAYQYLFDALSIFHQVVGPMHKDTATVYGTLAMVCYHGQDFGQAVEYQQKALAIAERVLGEDHPETAQYHSTIALLLHGAGQSDAALRHIKRALFLFELIAGPNHPDTAAAHINCAMIYQDTGRIALAVPHLQEALRRNKLVLGAEHTQTAVTHHCLAVAFGLMGAYKQAYEHEKRTKAIFSALLPENHPRVQDSMVWLNAFTRNAVQVAKGGAPTSFMEHGTPFTWISLRSTMPFKGRITMGDMLQLIETAARAQDDKEKAVLQQAEQERNQQKLLASLGITKEEMEAAMSWGPRSKTKKAPVTLSTSTTANGPSASATAAAAGVNGDKTKSKAKSKKRRDKKKKAAAAAGTPTAAGAPSTTAAP